MHTSQRRLESWKEIAGYLGVSERTARRYEENEGLPVHRLMHEKRGTVFALASELDEWRASRTLAPAAAPADAGNAEDGGPFRESAGRPAPAWGRSRAVAAILAGVALLALLAAGSYRRWRPTAVSDPLTYEPVMSGTELEMGPSLSPDGQSVAFSTAQFPSGASEIYLKRLGSDAVRRLVASPVPVYSPVWSPSGARLAYLAQPEQGDKKVFVVSLIGGTVAAVGSAFAPPLRDVMGGQVAWWNERELVAPRRPEGEPAGLFLVDLDSGASRRLTTVAPGYFRDASPRVWREGGRLAWIREKSVHQREICIAAIAEAQTPRCLPHFEAVRGLAWVPGTSDLLFSQGEAGNMTLQRTSPPYREARPILLNDPEVRELDVSADGRRLLYSALQIRMNLWLYPVRQGVIEVAAGRPWYASSRMESNPLLSPDGRRVIFRSNRNGPWEVWVAPLHGDAPPVRVPNARAGALMPLRWTPDGKSILMREGASRQGEGGAFHLLDLGSASLRRLSLPTDIPTVPIGFSPDGGTLYYQSQGKVEGIDLQGRRGVPPTVTTAIAIRKDQLIRLELPSGRELDAQKVTGFQPCPTAAGFWMIAISEGKVAVSLHRWGQETPVSEVVLPGLNGIQPACTPDEQYILLSRTLDPEADIRMVRDLPRE